MGKYMCTCKRELFLCLCNPTGARNFLDISQTLLGQTCRIAWVCFVALCRSRWHIRKKMTIEHTFFTNPAECIFEIIICMTWRR